MNAPIAVMTTAPSTRRDFASVDKLLDSNVSFNRHKPVQNKFDEKVKLPKTTRISFFKQANLEKQR